MKCPQCGVEMVRTPDKILTSEPPMYELKCPKCGAIKYKFVDEIDTPGFEGVHGSLIELPDPWFEFRCQAASRFMSAAYAHYGAFSNPRNIAKKSIEYADILIEELEKQK